MTPVETVAHALRDSLPDDEPMWSLIVIAKEVVAALGLREERHLASDCYHDPGCTTDEVRYVTDWQEVGE